MNTYLIPVTKEFQSSFTDLMIVYATTEKEAYDKAKLQKGLMPITIRKYSEVPYEFYTGELQLSEHFFPISKKHDIIKKALSLSKGDIYLEFIDIYDYMYWGDYNLQIQKLADKVLPEILFLPGLFRSTFPYPKPTSAR